MERHSYIGLLFLFSLAAYCQGFPLDSNNIYEPASRTDLDGKADEIVEISSTDSSAEETTLGKESESPSDISTEHVISSHEGIDDVDQTTTESLEPVKELPFVKVNVRPLCSGDICVRYLKDIREDLEESQTTRETPEDIEARSNREPVFDFEDSLPFGQD